MGPVGTNRGSTGIIKLKTSTDETSRKSKRAQLSKKRTTEVALSLKAGVPEIVVEKNNYLGHSFALSHELKIIMSKTHSCFE